MSLAHVWNAIPDLPSLNAEEEKGIHPNQEVKLA
jgi:hypothetical protein